MKHLLLALFIQTCIFVFCAHSSEFISRSQRIKIIETANLSTETQKMDELEKDMLILRAQKSNLKQLQIHYPEISPEKLEKIQTQLRNNH